MVEISSRSGLTESCHSRTIRWEIVALVMMRILWGMGTIPQPVALRGLVKRRKVEEEEEGGYYC